MPTTDTFYVSSKDNKVRRVTEPSREYFIPGGKKEGKAKYIIEVFGYNHEKVANEVRDMVDKGGMTDKLFEIRVETR
jgi:hypothetical protein